MIEDGLEIQLNVRVRLGERNLDARQTFAKPAEIQFKASARSDGSIYRDQIVVKALSPGLVFGNGHYMRAGAQQIDFHEVGIAATNFPLLGKIRFPSRTSVLVRWAHDFDYCYYALPRLAIEDGNVGFMYLERLYLNQNGGIFVGQGNGSTRAVLSLP